MVRFIIWILSDVSTFSVIIYIPIWLDLLFYFLIICRIVKLHLHSNMVRFIIGINKETTKEIVKFTFQYG